MPGAPDPEVLAFAQAEKRLLVTFDKDFGEAVFRRRLPAAYGVVLFRLPMSSPEHAAAVATMVLGSRTDWTELFAVVDKGRLRIRPLRRDDTDGT